MAPTPEDVRELARGLDLGAADFVDREFDTFELLRDHAPVARTDVGYVQRRPDEGRDTYFLSRYEDVAFAFKNPDIFASRRDADEIRPLIPQAVDPPEHTEYRNILNPWFSLASMTNLDDHIRSFAVELIDTMLADDEIDFLGSFAEPFPTIIFCELVGFPVADHPRLLRWKDIMIHAGTAEMASRLGLLDPDDPRPFHEVASAARATAARELYAYFADLLDQRRREPRDDMLTRLIDARYAGDRRLTQEELEDILLLLMMAGLDTVTGSLALIVHHFAERPDTRHRFVELMDDPQLVGPAIEELLRLLSTVTSGRRVTKAVRIGDTDLDAGDVVMLSTPSANRDERVFADPDEVVFDRHPNPHLGFAVGPHRCLGMHLARRELRIALQELHRRLPDYQLAPGHRPDIYVGLVKGMYSLRLVRS